LPDDVKARRGELTADSLQLAASVGYGIRNTPERLAVSRKPIANSVETMLTADSSRLAAYRPDKDRIRFVEGTASRSRQTADSGTHSTRRFRFPDSDLWSANPGAAILPPSGRGMTSAERGTRGDKRNPQTAYRWTSHHSSLFIAHSSSGCVAVSHSSTSRRTS